MRGSEFFQGPEKALKKLCKRLTELEIRPAGPAEEPKPKKRGKGEKPPEPLHERVIKRAELIRSRWKDIPTPSAVRRAAGRQRKPAEAEASASED